MKESDGHAVWEYDRKTVLKGEGLHPVLRRMGEDGWEAWHMVVNTDGAREVYFKRCRKCPK